MEERKQSSGKPLELTPEMELGENDEPIIELTEVVEPAAAKSRDTLDEITTAEDNDNIIELQDVVETDLSADEPIIELTDEVDVSQQTDIDQTGVKPSPEDESVLELTDVVESTEEDILELSDIIETESEQIEADLQQTEDDNFSEKQDVAEEILDSDDNREEQLGQPDTPEVRPESEAEITFADQAPETEFQTSAPESSTSQSIFDEDHIPAKDEQTETEVSETSNTIDFSDDDISEVISEELPETEGHQQEDKEETENQVIDLAAKLDSEPDTENQNEEIKIVEEESLDSTSEDGIFDDIAENIGLELEEDESEPFKAELENTQEIENAIEKVIEKRFGHRIEQLIVETIERAVRAEIERIKRALLDGSDQAE